VPPDKDDEAGGTKLAETSAHGSDQSRTDIEELVDTTPPQRNSAPNITLRETVAGRETLAAIAEELRTPAVGGRSLLTTLGYGDRVSNAPGNPSPATAHYLDGGPEVSVRETVAGRETLATIERELARNPAASLDGSKLEVLEMLTFIVRGPNIEELLSERARTRFVAERLQSRLPAQTMNDVERIDASPWGRGALLLRVWCRLSG